jgi:signal transduction histidine kinase
MIMEKRSRLIVDESDNRLRRQTGAVSRSALLLETLEAVSDGILVLNDKRQIVHANSVFLRYVGAKRVEYILGLDLGEALQCVPAMKNGGGCVATADACKECSALKVIIEANNGTKSVEECRVISLRDGQLTPLDIRVQATPFEVNQERFTLFVTSDIATEKQLAALERVFFHDIRNKASVIASVVEMMMDDETATDPRVHRILSQASMKMLNEIDAQEQLAAAERGELEVEHHPLSSLALLRSVVNLYSGFGEFKHHQVSIDDRVEDFLLFSDEALLGRVLGNMIKNALEASHTDDRVRVGCLQRDGQAHFWVHNAASIPRKAQSRLFTDSFSTKGVGRGLGTYGMRLLSERYLNGRIKVNSSPAKGTTFTAVYPLDSRSTSNGRMGSYLQA